jgi:hypothetical protein
MSQALDKGNYMNGSPQSNHSQAGSTIGDWIGNPRNISKVIRLSLKGAIYHAMVYTTPLFGLSREDLTHVSWFGARDRRLASLFSSPTSLYRKDWAATSDY